MSGDLLFALKKLAAALVLLPGSIVVVLIVGLLLARRRRGLGLGLIGVVTLALLALSTPAVALWMYGPFEAAFPPAALAQVRQAGAIVVLGAGRNRGAREYGGVTLSHESYARLRYGAWLARQSGVPLLVTGGAPDGDGAPEGRLMADILQDEFQLPARWVEGVSLDTAGNALYSARLLKADRVRRIALVTDVTHMRRGAVLFAAQGFEVITAPTGFRASTPLGFYDWLPNGDALNASSTCIREGLWAMLNRVTS